MRRYLIILLFFLAACSGQTTEELVHEGDQLRDQGNYRGAIVFYKNALEKDANFMTARRHLADAYLSSGSLDKAKNEFTKVLLQNPGESEILLKLAKIYLQKRKPEQALLELDKFHESNPETAESLVLYGMAHGSSGDLSSADSFFNKALQIDQQSVDARINLAKIALQNKDFVTARTYLEEVLKIDNKQVQAYYLLASLETRTGDRQAVLDIYQALLKVDSNQLEALYMSGIFQLDFGHIEATQKLVDQIIAKFPQRPEGLRLKGMLLYRQGQYEEAAVALQSSLQIQPHLLTYFFLGLSHYSQDQLNLALNMFQNALDLQPGFERARLLVALTLLKQKHIPDAIKALEQVLQQNKNNAYAYNLLGSALIAQGEYDRGMKALETATDIDPTLADAYLKRGVFHLAKGEKNLGEVDLLKAIEAAPEVMSSRLMLVTYYLRQKNYSSAIKLLKDGMVGGPADALLNNYLAAAYFSQKNPDAAVLALNQSKQLKPDYLTPYFNLASYYVSQSDYIKALAEYQQILVVDPNNIKALLGVAALNSMQGEEDKLAATMQKIEATETERGFVITTQFYLKGKDFTKAMTTVTRGVKKFSDSKMLLEMQGGLLFQDKKFDDAAVVYTRLAEIDPERGYGLLTRLYLVSGQQDKGERLIDDLLAAHQDQDYPYLLAAKVALQKRDVDGAIDILHAGISQVSKPVRLQMNLGQAYEMSGKLEQAEKTYLSVIKVAPRFSVAHSSLGRINELMGNKGAALDFYRSAVKYDKQNVGALNNLAYLLADNFGETKEALDSAMSAYRLQPGDPRIMDTLAFVLLKNGKVKEAVILLEKAHKLLPDTQTVGLHLAMAKIKTGEKEAAKQLLQEVINKGKSVDVEQAKLLLKTI